jgi:hypothetical protein
MSSPKDEFNQAKVDIYEARHFFRTLYLDFIVEFIGEARDIEKAIGDISVEQAFKGLTKATNDIMTRKLRNVRRPNN